MGAITSALVVPADTAYLDLVGQFVAFVALRMGFPDREVARIRLAVDEACANAVLHGRGVGDTVRVLCEEAGDQLVVRVQDSGPVFDLERLRVPDLDSPLEKRQVGGLGIYLMRRVMDSVELRPCDGGKEIVLSKVLPGLEGAADGH